MGGRVVGGRLMLLAALAGAALSACTMRPLYAPTAAGTSVATSLSQVYIDAIEPRLGGEVPDRVAQEIRNKLIFALNGGAGQPAAPAYRMKLTVSVSESALGVTSIEAAPAYSITVAATFEVTSNATGKIVTRATSRGTASYDRVNQVFANTRARLDAENRAAGLVADDIRIRLSAAAANGVI
ncbi:LPS assembly lipoprotein LptE [soil metagenome]